MSLLPEVISYIDSHQIIHVYHPPCPSEADKRASLTPPSATCWQSVLSISAQLINYKHCLLTLMPTAHQVKQ